MDDDDEVRLTYRPRAPLRPRGATRLQPGWQPPEAWRAGPRLPLRMTVLRLLCARARMVARHDAGHTLGPFRPYDNHLRYPPSDGASHQTGWEAHCLGCAAPVTVRLKGTRFEIGSDMCLMDPCPMPMVHHRSPPD